MSSFAQYSLEFVTGSFGPGVLVPVSVVVHEELSRPYSIVAQLRCDDGRVRADALLREPAEVFVTSGYTGDVVRRFSGVIVRASEILRQSNTTQRIQVEIVPPIRWLQFSRDSRIFQKLTTKDVVAEVFKQRGLPYASVDWRLQGQYAPRETCTQLDETCLQFVSRILEEDGIFYFHEHTDDGVKIVFGDDASSYSHHPAGSLPFQPETGANALEAVTEVALTDALRPARAELRDHDFKRPQLALKGEATGSTPFNRELYEYPGRFVDTGLGKRRSQARLDEEKCAVAGLRGKAHAFSLTPGFRFHLDDGPGATAAEWMPSHVKHVWAVAREGGVRYETTFSAIAATEPFRPRRITPHGRARGPHLAMVTGPAGEEIHCDEFGRIKVQFLWDRYGKHNETSSGWVRVSQMQSSGSLIIPRIGWEVLVEFEDGDPDKPVVVGRLYNGAQMPPVSLPSDKTITNMQSFSSPGRNGHNEIRINDIAGTELISMHSQKDTNIVVANDRKAHVTNNSTVSVGDNQTLSVGLMRKEQVDANDTIAIGKDQSWTVGAARTESVTGEETVSVLGNRSVTIGATHTVTTPKAIAISTQGGLSETVAGVCIETAGLSTSMAVGGNYSAKVGGAKLETVAASCSETTLGARTVTVGGAYVSSAGADAGFNSKGNKSINVGAACLVNGGEVTNFSTPKELEIIVGAALSVNATTIVFKVGDSVLSLSGGKAILKSKEITLNASGANAELAPIVGSK